MSLSSHQPRTRTVQAPVASQRAVYLREHALAQVDRLPILAPNAWQGEAGCAVGPFSSRAVAEFYAFGGADFGQYGGLRLRVVANRDSWYVEVRPEV